MVFRLGVLLIRKQAYYEELIFLFNENHGLQSAGKEGRSVKRITQLYHVLRIKKDSFISTSAVDLHWLHDELLIILTWFIII
jgi:hypothetical protein